MNKTYNGNSEEVRVFDGYSYEYDKQNRISAIKKLDVLGAQHRGRFSVLTKNIVKPILEGRLAPLSPF